jgi:hypothetical protein
LSPVCVDLLGGADFDAKEFGSLARAENHASQNGLSIQSQRWSFECDHASSLVMKARAEVIAYGLATKPRGRL